MNMGFTMPAFMKEPAGQSIDTATDNKVTTATTDDKTVTEAEKNNLSFAKYSILTWAVLFLVYLFWSWVDTQEGVAESVKPENIKTNARNLLVITLGAIIGINIFNVAMTKLSKLNIPILSPMAGALLPLARL